MKSKFVCTLLFSLFCCCGSVYAHGSHFHFGPGAEHAEGEDEGIHEEDDHFHFGPG